MVDWRERIGPYTYGSGSSSNPETPEENIQSLLEAMNISLGVIDTLITEGNFWAAGTIGNNVVRIIGAVHNLSCMDYLDNFELLQRDFQVLLSRNARLRDRYNTARKRQNQRKRSLPLAA